MEVPILGQVEIDAAERSYLPPQPVGFGFPERGSRRRRARRERTRHHGQTHDAVNSAPPKKQIVPIYGEHSPRLGEIDQGMRRKSPDLASQACQLSEVSAPLILDVPIDEAGPFENGLRRRGPVAGRDIRQKRDLIERKAASNQMKARQ